MTYSDGVRNLDRFFSCHECDVFAGPPPAGPLLCLGGAGGLCDDVYGFYFV